MNHKRFAYWVIFHAFLSAADFLEINFFEKFFQEYQSWCQTAWIQIRPDILSARFGSKLFAKLSVDALVGKQLMPLTWQRFFPMFSVLAASIQTSKLGKLSSSNVCQHKSAFRSIHIYHQQARHEDIIQRFILLLSKCCTCYQLVDHSGMLSQFLRFPVRQPQIIWSCFKCRSSVYIANDDKIRS